MIQSECFKIVCKIDSMPKGKKSVPIKESFVQTKNIVQTCD